MPNYKELGLDLRSLAQGHQFDDEADLRHAAELEMGEPSPLDIPELQLMKLGEHSPSLLFDLLSLT
jgi:hypothetical protein